MLELIGVRPEQLPRPVPSAAPVGHYRGVPVVAGALDQIAGMIGAGVCDGSEISEMTGTTMAICSMTDRIPPYREDSIVPCHMHAIPGQYCRILWSSTAGMALKWFRDSFAEQYRFDELDALAENIPAGCDGLTALPYLCGATMPRYRPDARRCSPEFICRIPGRILRGPSWSRSRSFCGRISNTLAECRRSGGSASPEEGQTAGSGRRSSRM